FRLVLENPRLRLIALLVVLLNVANTTGEYPVARLLSSHVAAPAAVDTAFDRQTYIGAFSGDCALTWRRALAGLRLVEQPSRPDSAGPVCRACYDLPSTTLRLSGGFMRGSAARLFVALA